MFQYAAKVVVSAMLIVAIAEVAKRSTFWAAALGSLPLTSILAFVWLHVETGDPAQVASLAQGIFWLVLPSLVLFLVLPILLRAGWSFWPSLAVSAVATACAYAAMAWALAKSGVSL
ncbi:MAG: DUF3147 family protein [Vicinamibacterales bacterium]